jgi:hypothetical protein
LVLYKPCIFNMMSGYLGGRELGRSMARYKM